MRILGSAFVLVMACWSWPACALEMVKVTEDIYAFVGEKQQRSAKNLANNATFGLIVADEDAVLVDPGGSWNGAEALQAAVRKVTDKPVRFVINTGGQDHRWLGNSYWRKQGATIIASSAAVADQKERGSLQLTMLTQLLGDKLTGTDPAYADVTFDDAYTLKLGNLIVQIRHAGQAHTPGDAFVWVPAKGTVFTGDIVYVERLLGVMAFSSSKSWLTAFEALAALKPKHVVPGHAGHGAPTTLSRAKAETYDYLVSLRKQIGEHIENGGDMIGAAKIDQSAFKHLELFDALAGRNAQAVFAEMEFE
jgi:glyoxylase-like metal-dependent hydrolase (beta-lactamase superfamily II)